MSTEAAPKTTRKNCSTPCSAISVSWCRSSAVEAEGGNPTLQIYTEEADRLIGREGETLEAIQFLLNRVMQSKDHGRAEVGGRLRDYRSMREDKIVHRVRELAERVRTSGRPLQLEPMNSYERRIVHKAFKDDPDIGDLESFRFRADQADHPYSPAGEKRRDRELASSVAALAAPRLFEVAAATSEVQTPTSKVAGPTFEVEMLDLRGGRGDPSRWKRRPPKPLARPLEVEAATSEVEARTF